MRILVTGANGLLGVKIVELATTQGFEVYRTDIDSPANTKSYVRLDLTDREAVLSSCRDLRPEAIINTAALTDVDFCEREKNAAIRVNADVAGYLAEAAKIVGAHMVQVSTDYVFDGEKGMYGEEDEPNPINNYGYSKLLGERKVASAAGSWCVARTSVIFGWGRESRSNFATWVLGGLRAGKKLTVVTDQYASPTFNLNLAEMLLEMSKRKLQGIYHTVGRDRINRYDMAVKIAAVFGLDQTLVSPTSSSDISWLAKRPRDSSLRVDKVLEELDAKPLALDKAIIEMCRTERRKE